MKKTSTFLVIVTLLTLQNTFARPYNSPTVQEQLEDLNEHWKGKNLEYTVLNEKTPLTNDVSLIQMHLSLVEKTLRNKTSNGLSREQKKNRLKCLDILHDYWVKGVFPKNLFHTKRTPYFIDKSGTACAVGQLIISTGYSEFAKKIMNENNNAYITELNSKYSEINQWATTFGFTIDELAWIQPCYCFTSTTGVLNVSCYGGHDGYFVPNVTGGVAPYTYNGWYWWNGTSWVILFCGGCDLIAGDYKCTVTDAVGTVQDYFATITQPPAISQTVTYTNDNGSCNGSAVITASGGTPGYSYSWAPGGYTNDSLTDLCQNSYTVTITDNNGCVSTDTVNISLATKIENISKSIVDIFPNPTLQNLNLRLSDFFLPNKTFAFIYNSIGQQIFYQKVESPETSIDLSHLENGIYFIRLDNGMKIKNQSFIKKK